MRAAHLQVQSAVARRAAATSGRSSSLVALMDEPGWSASRFQSERGSIGIPAIARWHRPGSCQRRRSGCRSTPSCGVSPERLWRRTVRTCASPSPSDSMVFGKPERLARGNQAHHPQVQLSFVLFEWSVVEFDQSSRGRDVALSDVWPPFGPTRDQWRLRLRHRKQEFAAWEDIRKPL